MMTSYVALRIVTGTLYGFLRSHKHALAAYKSQESF